MSFFVIFALAAVGYWIVTSVMGPGIDVSGEPRRPEAGTPPARQPQARPAPQVHGKSRLPQVSPRKTATPSMPAKASTFEWYIELDVPADASRREILEAAKRRLEVAEISGDTQAPARIARAAAAGMKLRPGNAGASGRRQ